MAYDDDDEATGKKRKRAKASSNPLSHARGKRDSKVDLIWHRKSGAGYSLFVAYYGGQPKGTVVADDAIGKSAPNSSKSGSNVPNSGAGMSRAAKRRKKKKNRGSSAGTDTEIETHIVEEKEKRYLQTSDNSDLTTSRLLQVLGSPSGTQHGHLRPFLESLSKPLPLTFRMREGISPNDEAELTESLSQHLDLVEPLKFGDGRIYQAKSSSCLAKASLSKLAPALKDLLVAHSANGTLARQELASMLPVIALKEGCWLGPHSRVLDVCASPGSKTLQALEIVSHKGRVRANDVHPARLASLQEAVQRSGMSPDLCSRISYTNHDASMYPIPKNGKLFDTVICDVPCSGDGTIRKDKHILPLWTPSTANTLHGLQVKILVRAIQLLKVGGVMSYSTCSLNPVEDEAVVAAALKKARSLSKASSSDGQPAVELVDWPHLEGFTRREGIQEWMVADYTGEPQDDADDMASLRWHKTFQDAVDANMGNAMKSMWPPEDRYDLHLERCTRLWPQDHDTGGFFVALIRKNR